MENSILKIAGNNMGTCVFCPMQCKFGFNQESQNSSKLGFDFSYAKGLCNKGLLARLLINHPLRVKSPYYCGNRISYLQSIRLLEPILNEKTAILMSGNITLDETIMLGSFINSIGSNNLAMISPIDNKISHMKNRFSYNTFIKARNASKGQYFIITVGDVFTNNPVMAKHILQAIRKPDAISKKNYLINISSHRNKTSEFADINIEQKPENILYFINMLKDSLEGKSVLSNNYGFEKDINSVRGIIENSAQGVIIFSPQYGEFTNTTMIGNTLQALSEKIGASLREGCDFCSLSVGSNSRGIFRILRLANMASFSEIYQKIENGTIENVIFIGCDYRTSIPFIDYSKIKKTVFFTSFASKETINDYLVIPHKLLFEKKGILMNPEDKLFDTNPVYYRDSSLSIYELAHELNHTTTKPSKMDIAKILASYEQVHIDDDPYKPGDYLASTQIRDSHIHDDNLITSLVRKHNSKARINGNSAEKLNLLNNRVRINNLYEIDYIVDNTVADNQIILPGFDEVSRQIIGIGSNAKAVKLSKSVTPLMNKTINQTVSDSNE